MVTVTLLRKERLMWIKRVIKETTYHEVWIELVDDITKTKMAEEFCYLKENTYETVKNLEEDDEYCKIESTETELVSIEILDKKED